MPRVWTLDTETKGTGAHIAPLRGARARAEPERELALVTLERPPRDESPPRREPAPASFKVVDVRAARVLAEGVPLQGALDLLDGFDSALDVRVYVRPDGARRWRLLTLEEHRALWRRARRGRQASAQAPVAAAVRG